MAGYVTAGQVRKATGVRPDDFKLSDSADLDELLERWSEHVKGYIDDHAGIDFLDEAGDVLADVPAAIQGVAETAVSRIVQAVRSHRDAALIRLDEWRVGIDLVDEVLPDHLRALIDSHMATRARRRMPRGFRGSVARKGTVPDG